MVNLSIIIPTIGRETLARTLDSIMKAGIGPDDQVLVAADGLRPRAGQICSRFAGKMDLFYAETPQAGCWGHPARNLMMPFARGSILMSIDDDDAYRPGALQLVREAALENPGKILIFRMQSKDQARHGFDVVWRTGHNYLFCGNVGTPTFAVPNVKGRLGRWGKKREGDYEFIRSTVAMYPNTVQALVWRDEIIVDIY